MTIPVALATETPMVSASRVMDNGPFASRAARTLRWTRLSVSRAHDWNIAIRMRDCHEVSSSSTSSAKARRLPGAGAGVGATGRSLSLPLIFMVTLIIYPA